MGSAGALYISIKGDTKDLEKALKSAKGVTVRSGKEMERSLSGVGRAITGLQTALKRLSFAGLIAGAAALTAGVY